MNLVVKFGNKVWICRAYNIHLGQATGTDELHDHINIQWAHDRLSPTNLDAQIHVRDLEVLIMS